MNFWLFKVIGPDNFVVPHQVSLIFKSSNEVVPNKYVLSFVARIPALGIAKYRIKRDEVNGEKHLAKMTSYNLNSDIEQ